MENTDAFKKVREMFASVQDNFLRTQPMFMRLNLLTNMLGKARNEGKTNEDIDWDKINEYLTTNVDEYDFNDFDKIESFDDLLGTTMHCHEASILNTSWHKGKCKDCGAEFRMSYNEVHFYQERGFQPPKRCKHCRELRRQQRN